MATASTRWEPAQAADRAAPAAHTKVQQPKPRWSKRRTLVFIVVVCGAFWAAAGTLVYVLATR